MRIILSNFNLSVTTMGYLFVLIATLFIIVLYRIGVWLHKIVILKMRTRSIPGPKGVPILGCAITLANLRIQVHWVLNQYLRFKDGLWKVWIGTDIVIMIAHPRHLEKILPSTMHIEKHALYNSLKPWLKDGLLTSGGHEWFHDRKLIGPTFHFSILKEYVPVMNEGCQLMLRCIEQKLKESPGEPIEIYNIIMKCALDILCSSLMGVDVYAQENDIEYSRALHKLLQLTFDRLSRPWFKHKWIYMLSPSGREYYANLKIANEFTRNVIHKRIEQRKAHRNELENENMVNESGQKQKKALLDYLLDASENQTVPLTEKKLSEQINTFIATGHETTATAFAWALFCLGNSPEHQEKVHQELDAVFGDSERPPTLIDLGKLKYLDRVLKESLRMYPIAPLIGRQLTNDVNIGEYILPKEAGIIISPIATHRHPDMWENPEKFDPDRFLPENMANRHLYAYIPFSAGPRNCIGKKFAQIEEKIMAIYILRRWKVKSVLRHDQVEIVLSITLRPLNGLHLYLIPRKRSIIRQKC